MSKEYVDIVRLRSNSNDQTSCLQNYIQQREIRTKKLLNPKLANLEIDEFVKSVLNLTNPLDEFMQSTEKRISYLVLGQVQSGKTAHLLATAAWATDSKIATAAILTGITTDLNEQTISRLTRDLGGLGDHFIRIFVVPTSTKGSAFTNLMSEVRNHVRWRQKERMASGFTPLPIFVLIKKKARIDVLAEIYRRLEKEFGNKVSHLLIDDEADQASQNALAHKREVAETYGAISRVLEVDARIIMLSYTATPQAVLLSEKKGSLQPDQCVVVPPRYGYFGLNNVVDDKFKENRVIVNDWNVQARNLKKRPKSLEDSILDFFALAWMRFNRPRVFYSDANENDDLNEKLRSVQMLVHESQRQIRQKKMYEFVEDFRRNLVEKLRTIAHSKSENHEEELRDIGLLKAFERVGLGENLSKDMINSTEFIGEIFSLINSCCIKVVNADKDRPNKEIELPTEDARWQDFRTWILVGGDILGRGLTIPQLTVTYFLRSSQKPNFDTVHQQMRFCGYRNEYSRNTYLYATEETFLSFEYMNLINNVVWNKAKKWDDMDIHLKRNRPQIMYATSNKMNMEACRKSVRDPDLKDIKIDGTSMFSARDIYRPDFVKQNLKTLQNWIKNTKCMSKEWRDWKTFADVDPQSIQELIALWEISTNEASRARAAIEIFDEDLGQLGLHESNIVIAVRKSLLNAKLNEKSSIQGFLNSIFVTRTPLGNLKDKSLDRWETGILSKEVDPQIWPKLQTHIGDEQRKLISQLAAESAFLIIEPILGTKLRNQRDTAICAGIAFTLLAPKNFEIRVLGHL